MFSLSFQGKFRLSRIKFIFFGTAADERDDGHAVHRLWDFCFGMYLVAA